jgi:hypothetical protein
VAPIPGPYHRSVVDDSSDDKAVVGDEAEPAYLLNIFGMPTVDTIGLNPANFRADNDDDRRNKRDILPFFQCCVEPIRSARSR